MDPIRAVATVGQKLGVGVGRKVQLVVWFLDDGSVTIVKKSPEGRPAIARSVTRHVEITSVVLDEDSVPVLYRGIGRNPDEPAVARLDAAELAEERTLSAYTAIAPLAEIKLAEFGKILARMRKFKNEATDVPVGLWRMVGKILRMRVENIFATVLEDVADAMAEAARAQAVANKVRAEVPRTVEFVF